ncbi:hypothetical protein Misp01_63300 [Microtetraspora sp. NBRC 13810]|uniref:GAF domain-containing protein n=1 Tax=Microtetraspora sp. NBRC 13810 TaxID=3030990 RepID=UPI00249F9E22|nr:GAF domain-containing protein [Microtetraspora sp. NBRC 13810]GLW11202.1 hypothetical protein Misp01_63300 [Microtetraspora sp. NBRC 13810]
MTGGRLRALSSTDLGDDLDLDDDPGRLRRWHESAMNGEPAGETGPRPLISDSWRRSLDAGIDPEVRSAPLALEATELTEARLAHPLHALLPLLTDTLLPFADDTGHIMIVTDAGGRILWRYGDRHTMRHGDRVGLSDGFAWSESAVGTNGIGTALAVRRPVHVYSAEHMARVLHDWSCAGAPIIDPDTTEILGCLDISAARQELHPATVALVETTARLAEGQLALRAHERDGRLRARYEAFARGSRAEPGALVTPTGRVIAGDPDGRCGHRVRLPASGDRVMLPGGNTGLLTPFGGGFLLRCDSPGAPSVLRLGFLGTDSPHVRLDGWRRIQVSLRHAEILALLCLYPDGMTAEQLSFHLYGDEGNPVTIRAEIHRLRGQLGRAIAAKPYRLSCAVEADFLELKHLIATRDPAALARAYPGPLLPCSEAPAIRREREELEGQVRARLLREGTGEDLWAYAQTEHGHDDPHILERVTALLPDHDHRAIAARLRLTTP